MVDVQTEGDGSRIILRPNRSWSWSANVQLLASLGLLSLFIAGFFVLNGVWMILLFSTLELSVLAICLYIIAQRGLAQEVITIDPFELRIESGRRRPETVHTFDRLFAEFRFSRPARPWHKAHLAVRSRGEEIAVGEFLTDEEKAHLAAELKTIIRRFDRH